MEAVFEFLTSYQGIGIGGAILSAILTIVYFLSLKLRSANREVAEIRIKDIDIDKITPDNAKTLEVLAAKFDLTRQLESVSKRDRYTYILRELEIKRERSIQEARHSQFRFYGVLVFAFLLVTMMIGAFIVKDKPEQAITGTSAPKEKDTVRVVTSTPAGVATEPKQTPAKVAPVFALVGYEDKDLIKSIEKMTGMKHKKSARAARRISITYTGQIKPVPDSELYYYPGGEVRVLIDGQECFVFEELQLSRTLRAGNPEDEVKKTVEGEIKDHINNHHTLISEKIKTCLN